MCRSYWIRNKIVFEENETDRIIQSNINGETEMNDVMRSSRAFIEATGQEVLGQISFGKVHTEDRNIVGKEGGG